MFPSDITVSQAPTVFIPFVTVSIFRLVTTVYESQRFLFCLSLHLFPKCPQFASTSFFLFTTRCILNAQFVGLTGFYSVYRRICFPGGTSCHSFTFRKSSREFTLVRLYMNVKQVEDSENRCGVYLCFCLKPTQPPHI